MIGGEPGIGKTRFIEELLGEARERGCLTLVGHCYEGDGHPPYVPWVEILERTAKVVDRARFREALGDAAPEVAKIAPTLRLTFPDIPPPIELPAEQQRRFLFNAYQQFVERGARVMPIVNVLEDLHWADEPTVRLLQHLAPQVGSLPLLLVGTYRDVELDVGRPWATVMASMLRERRATRITLRRLRADDIEALLAGLGGPAPPAVLVRAVFDATEGNPFFAEEVFQHLKEEDRLFDADGVWRTDLDTGELQVPEGVRLVIGRRLERVSEHTRKALTLAAVIGRNFHLSVLEQAVRIDPDDVLDALEEAERARLISSAASGRDVVYTFSHELIRQTLQQNLSLPRRQRVHLRVAEAIVAAFADQAEPHAAALAHHFYQAGALADTETTLGYLALAGAQAVAASAFEEAVALFTNALSFHGLDEKTRSGLLYERGVALKSLAQADGAIADWEAAFAIQERSGDATAIARTAWDLCWTFFWQDRGRDALDIARRAVHVVPDAATPERTRVLSLYAASFGWRGDYHEFRRCAAEPERMAADLGDQLLIGQVVGLHMMVHWLFLKVATTVESSRQAVEALQAADDERDLPNMLAIRGLSFAFGGRPAEAVRLAEEADRLATRVGYDGAAGNARGARWFAATMLTGDLDEMDHHARRALDAHGRAGPWSFLGLMWLSIGRFYAGDWQHAEEYSRDAPRADLPAPTGQSERGWRFFLQAYRGERSWLDEYRRLRDTLFRDGRTPFQGDIIFAFASIEALATAGEREEAHRLLPVALGAIRDGCVVIGNQMAETVAGIGAACGAEWETAESHFESALQQAAEIPHRIGQPEARRWVRVDAARPKRPGGPGQGTRAAR